jgi:hypothetical protein
MKFFGVIFFKGDFTTNFSVVSQILSSERHPFPKPCSYISLV